MKKELFLLLSGFFLRWSPPSFPTSADTLDRLPPTSVARDRVLQIRSLFLCESSLGTNLPLLEFLFRHDDSISIGPAVRSPIDALTESGDS